MSFDVIVIPANNAEPMRMERMANTLEGMKQIVGGWVEHVRIGDVRQKPPIAFPDVAMYVNEDGIAMGLSQNDRAAILYGVTVHGQGIYGDAIITGETIDPMEGAEIAMLPVYAANLDFWLTYIMEVVKTITVDGNLTE
jgi:hypothetical protein